MAKNEVLEAVLKDGKLYCGKCENPLGRTEDYYSITHLGENLTLFIRYCTKKGCTAKSQYQINLTLDEREVFVFPMGECKKIKEEKITFKEGE